MSLFIGIVLFGLALFATGLLRAYEHVPLKELRRRARQNDSLAKALYRAASYGYSLRVLLVGLSIAANAGLYFYIVHVSDPWLAVALIVTLLWFMYVWLPVQTVRTWMLKTTATVTPAITSILQYLHPLIDKGHRLLRRYRPVHIHTGMYEVEDILALLEAQVNQADNRIPENTIQLARSALTFGDKPVRNILTPRRVVMSVSVEDSVGPILLSELHESGFSRFPVYDKEPDKIVGILFLRDLVNARKGGKIKSYMQTKVCYVHEDHNLQRALDAVLKTHQQLFIVVNSFEEYVGVISIEDILEEILGRQIVDEFDAYEDMRAVAASQAKKDNQKHSHPAGNVLPDTGMVE